MFSDYVRAAMRRATYEVLPEGEGFVGTIPDCPGLLASGSTLEACRDELASALEDWLLIGVWHHDPLPVIDGLDLNIRPAAPDLVEVA